MKRWILMVPNCSVRGDAYVRRGAKPEDRDAWVIVPPAFRAMARKGKVLEEATMLREKLDPSQVEMFPTRRAATAWKMARIKWARMNKRVGPVVAITRVYEESGEEAA